VRLSVIAGSLLCMAPMFAVAQSTQPYFIAVLQVPKGASDATVLSIDEKGNAYGNAIYNGQTKPTVWQVNSTASHTLPDIVTGVYADGKSYQLNAASGAGSAAGFGVNSAGDSNAIYWDASGHPWELHDASEINGVSDTGVVVGDDGNFPLVWKNGIAQPIQLNATHGWSPCFDGSQYLCWASAASISPNGRFIGGWKTDVSISDPYTQSVLWIDGAEAGGAWVNNGQDVTAVNNSGTVVGTWFRQPPDGEYTFDGCSYYFNGAHNGYKATATTFIPLPGLKDPDCWGGANSINASGVVVGYSTIVPAADPMSGVMHAVIWNGTKVTDLNSLLASVLPANVVLTAASKITDSGKIMINGLNSKTGKTEYFVATPTVPTKITIASNINPSSYGQQIHLVASIIPNSGGVPLGQVNWYDAGKLVATTGLTAVGTASYEPTTLAPAVHKITVSYGGYNPDGASSSAVFNQTVRATVTKTTLSASATTVTHKQSFTLTATVVPAFGTIAGTVTFRSGSTTLGAAVVDGRTKQARLTTTINSPGKYSLAASYGATTNFSGSSSSTVAMIVK
jgi:hypothetical protein